MNDELRSAFAELARTCAQLSRLAEEYYYMFGDYSLIKAENELSRLGQRLESASLDRLEQAGRAGGYE